MPRTNCPNCAAPLNMHHKCEYCGTIVPEEHQITSHLTIDAQKISMVVMDTFADYYRDEKGMLHRSTYGICQQCAHRFLKHDAQQIYCSRSCERRSRTDTVRRDMYGKLESAHA